MQQVLNLPHEPRDRPLHSTDRRIVFRRCCQRENGESAETKDGKSDREAATHETLLDSSESMFGRAPSVQECRGRRFPYLEGEESLAAVSVEEGLKLADSKPRTEIIPDSDDVDRGDHSV